MNDFFYLKKKPFLYPNVIYQNIFAKHEVSIALINNLIHVASTSTHFYLRNKNKLGLDVELFLVINLPETFVQVNVEIALHHLGLKIEYFFSREASSQDYFVRTTVISY